MKLNKPNVIKLIKDLKEAGVSEAVIDSQDFKLSVKFGNFSAAPLSPPVENTPPQKYISKEDLIKEYESTLFGVD